MNDSMTEQDLKELEEQTAASEATWAVLQHINQTHGGPNWKDYAETVNTQSSSIHGKKAE